MNQYPPRILCTFLLALIVAGSGYGQSRPANQDFSGFLGQNPQYQGSRLPLGTPTLTYSMVSPRPRVSPESPLCSDNPAALLKGYWLGRSLGLFRGTGIGPDALNGSVIFNYTNDGGAAHIPGSEACWIGGGDYRIHFTSSFDTSAKLGNFRIVSMYLAVGTGTTVAVNVQGFRAGRLVAEKNINFSPGMGASGPDLVNFTYTAADAFVGTTLTFGSNWQFLDGIRFVIIGTSIPLSVDDLVFDDPVTVVPATQASNVSFSNTTGISTGIGWNNGTGSSTAVFMAEASSGNAAPVNGTGYTANSVFGSGTQIGSTGWYCVFNGTNPSLIVNTTGSTTVTGLTPGTTYRVMAVSYSGSGGWQTYNTTTATNNPGNVATITIPSTQASDITVTPDFTDLRKVNISWTNGNGAARAVFVRNSTLSIIHTVAPAFNNTYTAFTDSFAIPVISAARVGGSGWYCVYNGSGPTNSVDMNKITETPGQTFKVAVLEYNGAAGSETWNTVHTDGSNAITYEGANRPLPVTVAASNITTTGATLNATINPRKGNIANVTFTYSLSNTLSPVLGTLTTVTPAATSITGGLPATAVAGTVTGLSPSTTYYFRPSATNNAGTLNATSILSFVTGPAVSSVSASSPDGPYMEGGVITITVLFTAPVTVTGTPTLALNTGATATYTSGSGSNTLNFTYTVAAGQNSTDLDYTSVSALSLSGGTIQNSGGIDADITLPAPGSVTSLGGQKAIMIDTQIPGLNTVAIVSSNPNTSLARPGDVITVTITAGEPVSAPSVTIAGGAAAVTGTGTGWTATYTMTGSEVSGTIGFTIDFSDPAGNAGTTVTATTNSSSVVYDKTTPLLPAVTLSSNNANGSLARVGDIITVNFSSDETIALPVVTIAGNAAAVTNTGGNNWSATYTMATGDANGNVLFSISFADITGNAGATVTATTNSSSVSFDKTAPVLPTVTISSNNNNGSLAKAGDIITVSFSSDETIALPVVTIAGNAAAVTNAGGNNWLATYTMATGDASGNVSFSILFADITGNAGTTVNATTNSSSVSFDKTAPVLSTVAISSNNANGSLAKVGDIITVSFSSDETIVLPVVTIAGNAAAVTNAGGNNWLATYTMATGDASGNVSFSILFADITGNAGTTVNATTNSSSVSFDKTAPVLSTVAISSNNANASLAKAGDMISLTFTSNEALATPAMSIAGHAVVAANTSGNTWAAGYTMTDTDTEGVVPFSILFTDLAGNAGIAVTTVTDNSQVIFDRTKPFVTGHQRLSASPTDAATVQYNVVFSEKVTGVDISDFGLTTTSVSGAAVESVTGSDNLYTVTIHTGSGDGTIRLDLLASGTGIMDATGNTISGGYTSGEVYTISKIGAPAITVDPVNSSICAGSNTMFSITASSSVAITYQWQVNEGSGFVNLSNTGAYSNVTTNTLGISNGSTAMNTYQYRCVATNIFGSINSAAAVLTVNALPVVAPITGTAGVCQGGTVVLTSATTGGVWSSTNAGIAAVNTSGVVSGIATGTVTISYTVTNTNGCVTTVTTPFTVNTLPTVTIQPVGAMVSRGNTIRLTATASPGTTISWTPASSLDNATSFTPLARPLVNTDYTATVSTAPGCTASSTVTVLSTEDNTSLAPAVLFTPNGDGINDRFVIKNIDAYPDNTLQVFNKTGKIVFEARNYRNDWDGRYNNQLLPVDTYFYVLKVKGRIIRQGAVNIVYNR